MAERFCKTINKFDYVKNMKCIIKYWLGFCHKQSGNQYYMLNMFMENKVGGNVKENCHHSIWTQQQDDELASPEAKRKPNPIHK